ncbi:MAG: hypothetical protein J6U54_17640 [Clostridiales bacterium]|nr:hypothetical protein [Clostridiales bacterium]
MRTYSDLILLPTFEERFEYLKLNGRVGEATFGFDRWLNQQFYNSKLWEDAKREVIIRDNGCDLGLEGYEIHGRILVHHMNPIDKSDIVRKSDILLNPEYLISTCKRTHDAIHYGDIELAAYNCMVERRPNDTCPWKR